MTRDLRYFCGLIWEHNVSNSRECYQVPKGIVWFIVIVAATVIGIDKFSGTDVYICSDGSAGFTDWRWWGAVKERHELRFISFDENGEGWDYRADGEWRKLPLDGDYWSGN